MPSAWRVWPDRALPIKKSGSLTTIRTSGGQPHAMRRFAFVLSCLCVLMSAVLPAQAAPQGRDESNDGVLVLGRVSDDPKAHYDQLKPLLDYVIPRMAEVGIRSGRILMAKDLQQMSSYLRRGRVDWINETAGNAALLEQRGVAHAFLITERDGAQRYHSVFFVRRDSPIQSLQDLLGHRLAFQSPYSTSAYYLPAATLLERGLALEPLLSPMDRPAPDRVGYVFARTELNIATWVHKRLVDVGVLSNLDWMNPARMPPVFAQDFRVIGRTEDVPRALMLARTGLDPKVEARLREVLQEAAQDPEAGEALRRFLGTARMLPVSVEDRRALEWLGRGARRVRAEVE